MWMQMWQPVKGRFDLSVGFLHPHALRCMATRIPQKLRERLAADPRVAYIEPDVIVSVDAQTLPMGIDRITAELEPAAKIDGVNDAMNDDNLDEIEPGTDALDANTDDARLADHDENRSWGTSSLLADTDGDGLDDYDEVVTYGTDALASNTPELAPRGSPDNVSNVADCLIQTRLVRGEITPTAAENRLWRLE